MNTRPRSQQDTAEKADELEGNVTPPVPVIYETVRRHGDQEMERPAFSLLWSGLAAGLSLSFSLLAQAILRAQLPEEAPWRDLVSGLGYPLGFLIVVLGRQQLFTESTITLVLPVIADPTKRNFVRTARAWALVLGANLVGCFLAAAFSTAVPAMPADTLEQMLEISRHALDHDWLDMGVRGITAGYLMAALVWILPAAGSSQFHAVAFITYFIGVGGFAHIVAGSVEAFLLLLAGELGVLELIGGFLLPVLAGNMIGGTALFAMIAYAQVAKELRQDRSRDGPARRR